MQERMKRKRSENFSDAEWQKVVEYARGIEDNTLVVGDDKDLADDPKLADLEYKFWKTNSRNEGLGTVAEALVIDIINNGNLFGRPKGMDVVARRSSRRQDVLGGADIVIELVAHGNTTPISRFPLRIDVTCNENSVQDKIERAIDKFIQRNSSGRDCAETANDPDCAPTLVLGFDGDTTKDIVRARLGINKIGSSPVQRILSEEMVHQILLLRREWDDFSSRLSREESPSSLPVALALVSLSQQAHAGMQMGSLVHDRTFSQIRGMAQSGR